MRELFRWMSVVFACVALGATPALAQDDEEAAGEEADEADVEEGEADEAGEADEEEGPAKECPVPDVVKVGAFVNNIQVLDLRTHTYEIDAYIWFRWCNPDLDPATTMEFMNPSDLWGLMVLPNYEEPEEQPDGSLHQVLHIQGKFSTKMPLYDYPFDKQFIGPAFEDTVSDKSVLVYEVDDVGGVRMNHLLTLPGYVLGQPRIEITDFSYDTNFGDLRAGKAVYSRAQVFVPLTRPLMSQLTLLFVPLISVMLTATLMFVLGTYWTDSRVAVGTTALLTIVALQLTYNQEFSDVGYLMLMDKVYLASYLYVIAGLAVVVKTSPASYEAAAEDPSTAKGTPGALISTTVVYLIVIAILVALANF